MINSIVTMKHRVLDGGMGVTISRMQGREGARSRCSCRRWYNRWLYHCGSVSQRQTDRLAAGPDHVKERGKAGKGGQAVSDCRAVTQSFLEASGASSSQSHWVRNEPAFPSLSYLVTGWEQLRDSLTLVSPQ